MKMPPGVTKIPVAVTNQEFNQYTLTMDWSLTPDFSMSAMVGTSSSDFEQPQVLKSNIHAKNKVDIMTDFRGDRFMALAPRRTLM